ncbi:hypothetical protein EDD80_10936 [Anseongella ginsenosidimutans]|uniref:Uncharacterized protein n=1 Tax=Anseongella ginsenosidimutans TaxID=496056 RepID=A0A4R3KND9_9SPHI|nr:hypothetical protein [Anseongella ginsenosidimutans]QEC53733.1 hypothetical protein FRZ59_16245 [Anseongella ginsenosidimutans]TCS86011.1 hypothetical protein EDD80_10936 [Anseongella ginsenosidimutans]
MVKLTDQEVIRHYELRKQTLTEELSKVEAVLSALTARGTAAKANAKASKAKAGPVKKRKYTRRAQVAQSAPSSPAKAKPEGGWDSKINAALSQIGSGNKEEIVQFLAGKEPGLAPEKIRKAITLRLAVLLKKNKLSGEQAGDQYRYSLA